MFGKLVLIIGPSGVGKSVILKELKDQCPQLHFPRSATTRERRPGEGDELYRFVESDEFDQLIEQGEILEYAQVHGGARYGTLKEEIIPYIEDGKVVVREVDVQGFDSIRAHEDFSGDDPHYMLESIFILPDDQAKLITRITERAPISDEELAHRLESMQREMTYVDLCDHAVVNREGELDAAIQTVKEILFHKEAQG